MLCADDERISYGLSADGHKSLIQDGIYKKCGIEYIRTNVRIEKIRWSDIRKTVRILTYEYRKRDIPIVIFTHEWALGFWNRIKFEIVIKLLKYGGAEWIK